MAHKALVLDANILIRAVLGKRVRRILEKYADRLSFFVPEYAYAEAEEHLAALVAKRGDDPAQKSSVGNAGHLLANPLRADKSRGPSTDPARCRNGWYPRLRASSSCSRIIRPRGTPAFRKAASSHPAKSSDRRTVIVLLIRSERNTDCELPRR